MLNNWDIIPVVKNDSTMRHDEYSHPKTWVGHRWSAHHDESSTKKKVFQFLWQLTQSSRWGFVLAIWVNSGGTFSIMSNRLLLSSYFPFTKVNETYFPITVLLPFFPLEGIVHYVFWSFYFLYKIGESCYFFDSDMSNFVVWLVTHFPLIFKKPSF